VTQHNLWLEIQDSHSRDEKKLHTKEREEQENQEACPRPSKSERLPEQLKAESCKANSIKCTASFQKTTHRTQSSASHTLLNYSLTINSLPKMHFFTILLTALAASASATPVALANNEDVAALNDIAVRQLPGCNVLNCAGVLGAVTCLVPLIGQVPPNVPALVDCVPGGTAAVRYSFLFLGVVIV
jgi:hypothetical protein